MTATDVWRGAIRTHAPTRVAQGDVELCERLIDAFLAATEGDLAGPGATGVWGWIFERYQRPLAEAIGHRDARALAKALASMFQADFTWGISLSSGSMGLEHARSWLGSRALTMKCLDGLLSLGEALGVQPAHNPEQQRARLSLSGGLPELICEIEDRLGFRIDFPNVGAPYGLAVDGRLITVETPEQIYGAFRLDEAIKRHLPKVERALPRIVEIGGGYGAICLWYLRLNSQIAGYTIVDLPIVILLQGYFLGRSLGAEKVSFLGEPPRGVTLLPVSGLAEVVTPFDVLVNKDSMPEIPYDAVLDYLQWARANCDGFFFSYNHESGAAFEGHSQGRVCDAVEQTGSFERVSRERSWVRPGYVEEIYAPRAA